MTWNDVSNADIQCRGKDVRCTDVVLKRRIVNPSSISARKRHSTLAKKAMDAIIDENWYAPSSSLQSRWLGMKEQTTTKDSSDYSCPVRKARNKAKARRELRDFNRTAMLTVIQQATDAAVSKSFGCKEDPKGAIRTKQIKHSVKDALLRNYSYEFAHNVLITASFKCFKKKSAIQIQAVARGYLARNIFFRCKQ